MMQHFTYILIFNIACLSLSNCSFAARALTRNPLSPPRSRHGSFSKDEFIAKQHGGIPCFNSKERRYTISKINSDSKPPAVFLQYTFGMGTKGEIGRLEITKLSQVIPMQLTEPASALNEVYSIHITDLFQHTRDGSQNYRGYITLSDMDYNAYETALRLLAKALTFIGSQMDISVIHKPDEFKLRMTRIAGTEAIIYWTDQSKEAWFMHEKKLCVTPIQCSPSEYNAYVTTLKSEEESLKIGFVQYAAQNCGLICRA